MRTPRSALAIVALGALATGACKKDPNAADPVADKALIAKAKQVDADLDKPRREALVAAKGTLAPRPDLGMCPVEWKPGFAMKEKYGDEAKNTALFDIPRWKKPEEKKNDALAFLTDLHLEDSMISVHHAGVAFADEIDIKPGPRHFRIDTTEPLSGYTRGELQKYADPTYQPVDFQLIIDKEVPAKPGPDKQFEPGMIVGRFYAYDHREKKVVCAARVFALSSSNLKFSYTAKYDRGSYDPKSDNKAEAGERALRGDLREQALLSVVDKVYVAGPPVADPDDDVDGGVREGGAGDAGRSDASRAKTGK